MDYIQVNEKTEVLKVNKKKGSPASVRIKRKKYLFVYLMLLPAVINFAIFYVGININSFIMAFQKQVGVGESGFIYTFTFENFIRFFRELSISTYDVHISLINTLKYFLCGLLITLPISYFTAYFLYKKMWGHKFFKIVFFLPSIIPGLVYVSTFREMISYKGPLDQLYYSLFNSHLPQFLTHADTATGAVIFFTIWTGLGINLLLYQGAMGRIPEEVIEAGKLDGVGWVREMFQIITPMIWPTLSTTIVLSLSKIFMATGPLVLFDQAGSVTTYKMTTISYLIYQQTSMTSTLEYPAAISVFFTVISFPIVMFLRWLMGKIDPEVSY